MKKKTTILIADDEPDLLFVLKVYFEGRGFNVIACENGAQALAEFKHYYDKFHFPCFCILDYRMDPTTNLDLDGRTLLVQGGLFSAVQILTLEPKTTVILFSGDIETAKNEIQRLKIDVLSRLTYIPKGGASLVNTLLPFFSDDTMAA
ncbi:MAG TPA: hypothetical protein VJ044_14190 [Candidatus Hodarchaeales archaeon]|nr:hypothetical protein [Candidatus Hodarchaeales archaeon]